MASYFFGGPIADRFSARKLISLGLWATAFGGFILYLSPHLKVMYLVYGFWGVSTILLFWAPLIKATRFWGGKGFQGRAFGGLEAGRGAAAAILATVAVSFFATSQNSTESAYYLVLLFTSLFVALLGGLTWWLIPETLEEQSAILHNKKRLEIKQILKNVDLWRLSLIILSAYIGYKITDDFSLFAYDAFNFSEAQAAEVSNGAMWLRPLFALTAGFFADRFSGKRVLTVGFSSMLISGFLIYQGAFISLAGATLFLMGISLIGVYGIRGVYFSLFKEASVSDEATGTAVGIMSVVGYLPDIFMSPLMGSILDNNPGVEGHQIVFLMMYLAGTLGLVSALWLRYGRG